MSSKNSDFETELLDRGPSSGNIVSSKIVICVVVFFFVVVILFLILDLFIRRRRGSTNTTNARRGRARLIFQVDRGVASAPSHGLPAQALEALPISIYRSSDWEETTECAVCLSEIDDGEKIRLLPSCKHCFHVDCIDMWFHSHSTCPLCRNSVTDADGAVAAAGDPNETSGFGSGAPLATAIVSDRALVIEIPRRTLDAFTSPTNSSLPRSRRAEEMKSPAMTSATPSRLRSLKRMLSRDKRRAASSSCSSPYTGNGGDLETGLIGVSSTAADECDDGKGSHKNL